MTTILLLAGAGFVLLLTEMFLPGGVLGALGALFLVAAVAVGYAQFGALTGTVLLAALAVATMAGFCAGMAVFPRTAVGRRLTLARSPSTNDPKPAPASLIGAQGVALTPLRPAGKALLAERRVDVVAEGAFIDAQAPVVVIASEGPRVVVRLNAKG